MQLNARHEPKQLQLLRHIFSIIYCFRRLAVCCWWGCTPLKDAIKVACICAAWGRLNELHAARCAPPVKCCCSPPPTHPSSTSITNATATTIITATTTTTTLLFASTATSTTTNNQCALRSAAAAHSTRFCSERR
jgi:hypothetical protein